MFIYLNRTGLQRTVPAERCTASSTCRRADMRTRASATRQNLRRVSEALARRACARASSASMPCSTRRTRRRLPVLRSAVCAAEQDRAIHELHGGRFRSRRSGTAARRFDHAGKARLPCCDEQLDGARNRRALRRQQRSGGGRTAMLPDSGAPGDQLEREHGAGWWTST